MTANREQTAKTPETRPARRARAELQNWIVDRSTLAFVFGVESKAVSKFVERGMPPPIRRGEYVLPDCVQWRIQDVRRGGSMDPDQIPEVVEARTELYRAQHAHKRIESARLAGELLPFDNVMAEVAKISALVAQGFEQFVGRCAEEFAAAETLPDAMRILSEHERQARQRIADGLEQMARDFERGIPDSEAAADEERGGMG